MNRQRLLYGLAVAVALLAGLVLVLVPRASGQGTALVLLASARGDTLSSTTVMVGGSRVVVGGAAPAAPETRIAARLALPPGTYPVRVGTTPAGSLSVSENSVGPLLLAVAGGRVASGGVYPGVENVNLGLQELSGRMAPLPDLHLVDQAGRALTRADLLGADTVIAAFHTSCRETCPLYTGLMFQLRRTAPAVRLVEVTTDPAADTPAALAAYRTAIGADWTFATGAEADLASFWARFGVQLSAGDSHTSALALVDRHGFIRASYRGVPDLGGRLPGTLTAQLDDAGRQLLAGHGEGWGAPQVVDSLRTIAAAPDPAAEGPAPAFSLPALDGRTVSLEEFRGRPVILNFWWAGCPPCRQEMPLLQRYADEHPDVTVLLIDHRDSPGTARAFAEDLHVHLPVLLDGAGQVAAGYRVAAFPTSFFLRPDGSTASTYPGALTSELLTAHMSNLGAG